MTQPQSLRLYGAPDAQSMTIMQPALAHSQNIYTAIMDEAALWNPGMLDKVVAEFPPDLIKEADLYLVITECIANAAMHGYASALAIHARRNQGVLLISFLQLPQLPESLSVSLARARNHKTTDYLTESLHGLGFPLLLRLAHKITISTDHTKLQFWFRPENPQH